MLAEERFNAILNLVNIRHAVTVSELTEFLNISESTVRRDLTTLHEMGKLKKVHGGAVANDDTLAADESDISIKALQNVEKKEQIARYAAGLIHDDDFVFIDSGTTTEKMIDCLENTKATFVTNGIIHAKKLIQKGFKAYIIGGEIKLFGETVIGSEAVADIRKYNFTKCFIGTNGVSPEIGFTTPDIEEAFVKSEVISHSYVTFVLADSSKFEVVTSVTFASINHACIITDRLPDKKYHDIAIVKEVLK